MNQSDWIAIGPADLVAEGCAAEVVIAGNAIAILKQKLLDTHEVKEEDGTIWVRIATP
ncbi:MAG: hypothetical protein WD119_00970 [Pirellulaceae bacterium]